MAERGFATLAFDPSYTGESGGEPRNVASPDINIEDFSAAVDYLGLQSNIDRQRIGIIGICGWGGMALGAAAVDKRIKAHDARAAPANLGATEPAALGRCGKGHARLRPGVARTQGR
ncbi:hypothetical protein G6F35_018003 [Rhizopus arrhizus]|nr:hypothetical protein G6F35_018003 [Rhizopus arrhizus]